MRLQKTLKCINLFLQYIDRNKYNCTGKPEPLGENLPGFWNRRIDDKNRLVYRIHGGNVEIAQCQTHYKDK
ncbi:MAG: Txe/YoeB family addiction module toxin [Ethanoligenens sp.]